MSSTGGVNIIGKDAIHKYIDNRKFDNNKASILEDSKI